MATLESLAWELNQPCTRSYLGTYVEAYVDAVLPSPVALIIV